jgi:hypothetical protein
MSEENFTETDLLEDILHGEDEPAPTGKAQLKTGVAKSTEVQPKLRQDTIRPNATRWAFNPFEIVNLMNKPASCGLAFIYNVVFNKIVSLKINVASSSHDKIANLPNDPHDPNRYDKFDRTSYMIAREFEEHYGDKGVVIIEEITGEDDEEIVGNLNTLLFGDEVECVEDINSPEFPCPVLPTLLERMQVNVTKALPTLDADTRTAVLNIAKKVRESVNQAMKNAQARIDIAQARVLDDKQPNRTFSHAEQRCFLALGLEVPNALPFVGRSQSHQQQGIDSEAIGRGIAAGMAQSAAPPTFAPGVPNIPATAKTGASAPDASFEVTEGDIEVADTGKKGGKAK